MASGWRGGGFCILLRVRRDDSYCEDVFGNFSTLATLVISYGMGEKAKDWRRRETQLLVGKDDMSSLRGSGRG